MPIIKEDCVFCKIVSGEIPAKVVAENEGALAFLDVSPLADGHVLVIPKSHSKNMTETDDQSLAAVFLLAKHVAKVIDNSKLNPWGFNFLSNQDAIAGQKVFHFHLHVIPKYGAGEGFILSEGTKYLRPLEEVCAALGKSRQKLEKK